MARIMPVSQARRWIEHSQARVPSMRHALPLPRLRTTWGTALLSRAWFRTPAVPSALSKRPRQVRLRLAKHIARTKRSNLLHALPRFRRGLTSILFEREIGGFEVEKKLI